MNLKAAPSQVSSIGTPALQGMIRHYACQRFQTLLKGGAVTTAELQEDHAQIHGSTQAIVLIAGPDLKVMFKAHFNLIEVPALLQRLGAASSSVERQRQCVQDFFREYANLTAGGVKRQLQEAGIESGISLPVITSGIDELFFAQRSTATRAIDAWAVQAEGVVFICTSVVDLGAPEVISNFHFAIDDAEMGDGLVEFL